MKLAFHMMGGGDWTGGPMYLRNLFYALRQTRGKEVGLYLLAPAGKNEIQEHANSIKPDGVILYNIPQRGTFSWAIYGAINRLLSRDMAMERILKQHGVNGVFGSTLVYQYDRIATLSWLPDFQHIQLPEMFSKAERLSRDRRFLRTAKLATRITLMSGAVRRDFESFAPMYAHKARVLRPVAYIPQWIYNYDLNSILNLYHLPQKFIYLPNQFWKHKNHELAFQAIKISKDRGIKLCVVCSGSPLDYRHPGYFAEMFRKLSQWNIRDLVVYLGLIPHEHVLLLMRQSICVLNPSLFEGWGCTVDEARSVGKQVLLSEIPVHREQNIPKAIFFDPKDSEDLAEEMSKVWQNTSPGPDIGLEYKACETLPERIRAYAESFISMVQEVI